jgi:hypothetical protein
MAAFLLAAPRPCAAAGDDPSLEKEQPVAIVAGVRGDVQIRLGESDWKKCYALDLVRPSSELQTGADGAIVVIFFYDDHREMLGPSSVAKSDFRNLTKKSGTLKTERSKSGGSEFDVPYITTVKLNQGQFANADAANEQQKETDYLSAYVDVTQYPPIFHWRDLKTPPYRLQLFDEKKQFLYEKKLNANVFRFPYTGMRLTKSGQYYWQVLAPQDVIVVARYGFRLLTRPLVKYIAQQEREYDAIQAKQKGDTVSATELFLVYNQYRTLDKGIHLLQVWREMEPDNPNVYRYLTRAYILRGCPLNARQALQQEIQLGGTDPVLP